MRINTNNPYALEGGYRTLIELYLCELPKERNQIVLEKLLPHMSYEKQERIKKIVKINDAYRTLLGELLVRFALYKRYGSVPEQLEFDKNFYGKPFLCQYPFFHYNVSHSGDWVACVVHNKRIGVDIEKILPFDWQMAKGFFTRGEYWDLLNTKKERNTFFYDIWTLKESYVKAQGRGLSIPLNSFSVRKHTSDRITLTDMKTGKVITDFTCKQYKLNNQYRLSVCVNHDNKNHFAKLPFLVTFHKICNDLKISLAQIKSQ